MYLSVRENSENGQVSRREGPQQSTGTVPPGLPAGDFLAQPAVIIVGTTLVLGLFCGVILPAVWSRQGTRRRAAYTVMDRILRFMRPRS